MDKRKAIQIITKAADLYHTNLEDQKILFLYGAAGNVCGCIGFVKDRNSKLNVPNTLLKKDIRDVISSPVQKVYAVISKNYCSKKYSVIEKVDKELDIKKRLFSDEIESILDRENF